MEREVWSDIPGYESYQVSYHGEVRRKRIERILKQTIIATGDRTVGMVHEETKEYSRHRVKDLVWLVFRKEAVPAGMIVRHINGNRGDNTATNLVLGEKKYQGLAVKVRNVETGEVFRSMTQAAKTMDTTGSHLSYYIRNNKPFRGQRFEIVEEQS